MGGTSPLEVELVSWGPGTGSHEWVAGHLAFGGRTGEVGIGTGSYEWEAGHLPLVEQSLPSEVAQGDRTA